MKAMFRYHASAIALGMSIFAIADAANAQTAPQVSQGAAADANDVIGGDIVVTARRRAEDASKVPISITAFSSAAIEAKHITNVADLTKLTPGLNITGGGTRTNVFITIRGQSRGNVGNVSPGVLTYFNEVPLPTYGSLIQTYDMENIQVLKGPQGTLFGRNSIGGAVLTYSKAPTHSFEGYVQGEIGMYKNKSMEGAINIPIVSDKVSLRLAGRVDTAGGYTKTYLYSPYQLTGLNVSKIPQLVPSTHDADEYADTSFRVSLTIEPFEGFKNTTVYDYTRVRGQNSTAFDRFVPPPLGASGLFLYPAATLNFLGANGNLGPNGTNTAANIIALAQCGTSIACDTTLFAQAVAQGGPRVAYTNLDPWKALTTVWGISNTTTLDLSDSARLKNIFGYRTNDSFTEGDIDGTPLSIVDTRNLIRLKQITEELQLSGELFDRKLKYTIGGFYYKQAPNGLGGSNALEVNAFFGLAHTTATSYFTDSSKSVYGQIDYSLDALVPGLTATAGFRQNWDTSGGCVMSATYLFTPVAMVQGNSDNPVPSEATCRAGTYTAGVNNTAVLVSSAVLPPVEFKKATYNFGLNWQITPDIMVYGATRRGYRAGSYNSPLYDPYLASVQTFKPETLTDVEIGAKLRFNTGGMNGSLDVALFRGKDKGVQLAISTSQLGNAAVNACIPNAGSGPNPCTTAGGVAGRQIAIVSTTTYNNAGDATIQGFEAAATLSPIEGLQLNAGVAYVDLTTDKVTLDPNLLNVLTLNGRSGTIPKSVQLRQQPAWTVTAGAYYQHPQPVLGGKAFLNVDLRHRTSFAEGEDVIAGATTVDARVGINNIGGTGLDIAVNATNLFDKLYDYGTVGSALSSGFRSTLRAAPRVVSLSVRYSWGR